MVRGGFEQRSGALETRADLDLRGQTEGVSRRVQRDYYRPKRGLRPRRVGEPDPRASSTKDEGKRKQTKEGRRKQTSEASGSIATSVPKSRPSCASTEWDGELRWNISDEGE